MINVKLGYDFSMIDETSLTSNSGRQKAKASFGGIEGDVKKKASNIAKPPKKCSFHQGFTILILVACAVLSLAINEYGLKEGLRCGIFLVAVFLVSDVPAVMLLKENRQFLQL